MTPDALLAVPTGSGSVPEFRVPADGEIFTNEIIDRCETLIKTDIWEGLDILRLRTWMNNFRTTEERFFAACVLDALIYRSEQQTRALMHHLLHRSLVEGLCSVASTNAIADELPALLRSPAARRTLRLVPVIRDIDPPTKSGVALARMYRRHFGIRDDIFLWPWRIDAAVRSGVRLFIFLDDFVGTGHQFIKFGNRFRLRQRLASAIAIYAPLVAHERGLSTLATQWPELKVCPVERLMNRHGLFASDSPWFQDGVNTSASAEVFYNELLSKYNLNNQRRPAGFGDLALAYGFAHGTPNNCLPILWRPGQQWRPLLER